MVKAKINGLRINGAGIGQSEDGRCIIPGAIPGDTVEYTATGTKRGLTFGVLESISKPSADRVDPTCPHWTLCGGCDLGMMKDTARVEHLTKAVTERLRYAGSPAIVTGGSHLHYRARVKLTIEDGKIGFREARTHHIVEIDQCQIARQEVNEGIRQVKQAASKGLNGIESIEVRTDGERVVFAARGRPDATARANLKQLKDISLNGKRLYGDTSLEIVANGVPLTASKDTFYQVNLEVNELLVQHVLSLVQRIEPERVLDLYSGIGNFTIPIAKSGVPVTAVELSAAAIASAQKTADNLNLTVNFVQSNIDRFDPSTVAFDLCVLDPPRTGAGDALKRLVRNRPRAIIYVSCDINSAVGDIRSINQAKYRVTDVKTFDMFPQTHHIETVILLER